MPRAAAATAISVATLVLLGIGPTQARLFAAPLSAACARFDIDTPARVAAFVAQCNVESRGFTALEENLRWRDPARLRRYFSSRVHDLEHAARLIQAGPRAIANCVYAGKNGNGDEASGDGWRYRGRGLKQLTGRANYRAAADALTRPYVELPHLVAQPEDACLTAAWFWHSVGGNGLADSALWDTITRRVNGPAMDQAGLRAQLSAAGLRELGLRELLA